VTDNKLIVVDISIRVTLLNGNAHGLHASFARAHSGQT
jgi:hypothetical protein